MTDTKINLNPVCTKDMVYLPFSFFGMTMAVTIKPKDKDNLYIKFENPARPFEGDIPKKEIAPLVNTLYDFVHNSHIWDR